MILEKKIDPKCIFFTDECKIVMGPFRVRASLLSKRHLKVKSRK